jgi:hypothetical protein
VTERIELLQGPVILNPRRYTIPVGIGAYTSSSTQLEHDALTAMQRLTTYVLTRHLAGDQHLLEVRHPATWWQHLKLSLPGWVQKRWPVRWTKATAKVSFAKYDTYPGADIMPRELGMPVQFDTVSFDPIDYDGPFEPLTRSTPVNAGREFLNRKQLMAELSWLLDSEVIKHTGYQASLNATSVGSGQPVNARIAAQELVKILERLGVNPDQLVQQYAIDEARRTW